MALARALHGRGFVLSRPLTSLLASGALLSPTSVQSRRKTSGIDSEGLISFWESLLASSGLHWSAADAPARQGRGFGDAELRDLLHTALRVRQGRVSTVMPQQVTATYMNVYQTALRSRQDKQRLFELLCRDFGIQVADLEDALAAWKSASDDGERGQDAVLRAAERVRQASMPLYANLFPPISNQPAGLKFLVDMRADVLEVIKHGPAGAAPLRALSETLRRMLSEWFSVGLLSAQRITWEHSPAALLEKVMRYEAVHPIDGWLELRARLAHNRRVWGFFHGSLPEEPLVLLHTALMPALPASLEQVLSQNTHDSSGRKLLVERVPDASEARVAVFYSISATQRGLSGIDLGNFLIKEVAHKLLAEFPNLDTLMTLSPIPGFRPWLKTLLQREVQQHLDGTYDAGAGSALLLPEEARSLDRLLQTMPLAQGFRASPVPGELLVLEWALTADHWLDYKTAEELARPILMRLAARYLLQDRRRRLSLDPVANFHLRNGASVAALHWGADLSSRGRQGSYGIMVNYQYVLDDVARNNHAYLVDGEIAASAEVKQLLRPRTV